MTANDAWNRVSVCIVTLNEESNLTRCLESFSPCAEIIVVDSGSTDQTREIAERFGARWFVRHWDGFAKQREFAEQQATREFVLFLDADEWLGGELRDEISNALGSESASHHLYSFRRRSEFLGRQIRHGDWSNDWVTRLAPRNRAAWRGKEPHPFLASDQLALHKCFHTLLHRPYRDENEFAVKNEAYARALSPARPQLIRALLHATWRFFRGYLFRAGFLDGYAGYALARGYARMVYRKYAGARTSS